MSPSAAATPGWTLGRRIGAGYALSFLLLLVVAIFPYRGLMRLVDSAAMVAHTHVTLTRAEELYGLLRELETGTRGYALTGQESLLDVYRQALPRSRAVQQELLSQTSDNPVQQRRLQQLEPLIAERIAFSERVIETRRTGGLDAAARLIAAGTGSRLMEQIRALVSEFEADEEALLAERQADNAETVQGAKLVIVAGTLISALVLVLTGLLITRAVTAQVGVAVAQVQSSVAELQSSAAEQSTASTEQKASSTEASTTLKELVATSRQMAESAQRVTHIAEETAAAARQGDQTVARAQEAIGGIKRQVDQIVGHMLDLGQKSQQIGGVLELINELADQTNILAINASIESAGAGEAGKRFAVVAEEIRKLADRVGLSTKEIRTLIEQIRSAANTTVMATEDGAKAVEFGARQFTDVAGALRAIGERVSVTTDAAREIELGSRQQVTAVEQCSVALQGIVTAATQNEITTRQTADTATQLVELSAVLRRLVKAD